MSEKILGATGLSALITKIKGALSGKADKANITGATKCKITYNGQGIITSGADLASTDIPNLDASKITSGTFSDARIASAGTWNAKQNALPTSGTASTTYAINVSGSSNTVANDNKYFGSKTYHICVQNTDNKAKGWCSICRITKTSGYGSWDAVEINGIYYNHRGNWNHTATQSVDFHCIINITDDVYSLLIGKSHASATGKIRLVKIGARDYELQYHDIANYTSLDVFYQVDGRSGYVTKQTGWVAGNTGTVCSSGEYLGNGSVAYEADYARMQNTNEVNFRNVPTSGNKSDFWFNYRNGDTNAADSSNLITNYYFGNRNNTIAGVKLYADSFSGNAATATDCFRAYRDNANTFVVKRQNANGGALIRYIPLNNDNNGWRAGAANDGNFLFQNTTNGSTFNNVATIDSSGNFSGKASTAGTADWAKNLTPAITHNVVMNGTILKLGEFNTSSWNYCREVLTISSRRFGLGVMTITCSKDNSDSVSSLPSNSIACGIRISGFTGAGSLYFPIKMYAKLTSSTSVNVKLYVTGAENEYMRVSHLAGDRLITTATVKTAEEKTTDLSGYTEVASAILGDAHLSDIATSDANGKNINSYYYKSRDTVIGSTTDFNTITTPGCYKVQMSGWGDAATYHSPNQWSSNIYSYGLLQVIRPDEITGENRVLQIYYPHRTNASNSPVLMRMNNSSSGYTGWQNWARLAYSSYESERATGDASGNDIKATYGASVGWSDSKLQLYNKNGVSIGSATIQYATSAGSCSGTSAQATKAQQDWSGNTITTSYASSLASSGNNIQLKSKSGAILSSVTPPYATSAGNAHTVDSYHISVGTTMGTDTNTLYFIY